ncbi:MAG: CRISPR-associated protein Cas4 [Thermoplasmataceae archaeon]
MKRFSYEDLTGTLLNYYGHCKRQAWLFSRGMTMESDSDRVKLGKWIDENTYKKRNQVELPDKRIKVDFITKGNDGIELHEVKSSKIPKPEHKIQLGFYLLKLEESEVNAIGVLNYPEINKIIKFKLDDIRSETKEAIDSLINILNGACPARLSRSGCRGCAYFELCYSSSGDLDE